MSLSNKHHNKEDKGSDATGEARKRRSRSRSREKQRNKEGSRQHELDHKRNNDSTSKSQVKPVVEAEPKPLVIPEDQQITEDFLKNVMGFSGFSSSKGKDHSNSSVECVQKLSQVRRKYRQYMNRRGGFNRNLDEMKD